MKRSNNKILFIVLLVLMGAFALTRVFRSPARESNVDTEALKADTAGIDKIHLYPAVDGRKEIKLSKEANGWKVSRDKTTALANTDLVKTLLLKMATLTPERMATRKEEKWNEYQVSDTTGTDVAVFSGEKELARIKVGKESMGATFIRRAGDNEVYAVSGTVASAFNRKFNDWRDPSLVHVMKDRVTKITFDYPADSGFVLARNGKAWMIGNLSTDSAKTENYLNKLKLKELINFADDFHASSPPDVTVTIEAPAPFVVKGWRASFANWILTSDLQPGVYFSDEGNLVARDIFPGRKSFLK
jgi:hypothetical protein